MEKIVLMGGPCSGQIHDLPDGAQEVLAIDELGNRHVYMRTELVNVDEDVTVVVFRLALPES